MTGHSKGILSTDWCQKDSDLLISCGKDNRTIVWNVSTGEPIGDLFHSTNWTFDAKWCPRIPDMCAVASYDGIVGVHSILRSSEHPPEDLFSPQPAHAEVTHDPDDPFSQIGMQTQKSFTMQPVFTLPQPPKWLRKPVGAVFGFGAKLITFDTNSTAVSMKKVPICDEILFRADQLDYILSERNPQISAEYCDYVAHSEFIKDPREKEIWKIIKALFSGNMKAEMTDFLGFDPQFANEQKLLAVFSKLGIDLKEKYVDDDVPEEEFQGDQNENSISAEKKAALLSKATPFALYPARTTDDNEIDIAITKCLVVGDFETAVTICLGSNRIADALILAINGGPHLIKRAQDKYFEKNCNLKSYSRLLKAVLAQDISDIVANCKLDNNDHWRDIVGIIATYANPEDIVGYFIQLGNRLSGLAPNPNTKHSQSICFLGAGNFEKVMECWSKNVATPTDIVAKLNNVPLQSLMEKVSVFQDAVQFQDQALRIDREDADIFPLSYMYELYTEYSWLATLNGQVDIAYRFLERIPIDFIPSNSHVDILNLRDQVYNSKGVTLGATGAPPLFPFERIEVVDYNAMVLAEQQQQERIALQQKQAPFHSNATSPNNQAYGYNQPAQNYGTQQYSTSSYQSQPQSGYQAAYQSTTNVYQSSPYQQNAQPPVSSYQNTINPPPTNNFQNSPYPQAAPTFHQAAPTPTWNSTPQPAITPSWNQPAQTLPPPPITQGHTGHGHTVPSTYQPPFVPPTNPYDRRQSQTNFGTSATSLGPSPTHPTPIVEQPTKPQIINPGDKSCYDGLSKHLVHLSETATMVYFKLIIGR